MPTICDQGQVGRAPRKDCESARVASPIICRCRSPVLKQFISFECRLAAGRVLLDAPDRLADVAQAFQVVSHSGIASRRTRSRIRAFRPRSVTTSTWQPRTVSRSIRSPPKSKRVRPGSRSTSRSMSLSSSSSPRAAEPKTRTLRAPWRAAVSRIAARHSRIRVPRRLARRFMRLLSLGLPTLPYSIVLPRSKEGRLVISRTPLDGTQSRNTTWHAAHCCSAASTPALKSSRLFLAAASAIRSPASRRPCARACQSFLFLFPLPKEGSSK